jgi:hypothetical protein
MRTIPSMGTKQQIPIRENVASDVLSRLEIDSLKLKEEATLKLPSVSESRSIRNIQISHRK